MYEMVQFLFDSKNRYRWCLTNLTYSHWKSLRQLGEACKDEQNYIPQVPAAADKTN